MENIIHNGMDAIDRENGEIIVALRKVEDKIKIRIQDNGKEYQKIGKIFLGLVSVQKKQGGV